VPGLRPPSEKAFSPNASSLDAPLRRNSPKPSPLLPKCPALPTLNDTLTYAPAVTAAETEDTIVSRSRWHSPQAAIRPSSFSSSSRYCKIVHDIRADVEADVRRSAGGGGQAASDDPELTRVEARINDCIGRLEARLNISGSSLQSPARATSCPSAGSRQRQQHRGHSSHLAGTSPSGSSTSTSCPRQAESANTSMSGTPQSEQSLKHTMRFAPGTRNGRHRDKSDTSTVSDGSRSSSPSPRARGRNEAFGHERHKGLRNPFRTGSTASSYRRLSSDGVIRSSSASLVRRLG